MQTRDTIEFALTIADRAVLSAIDAMSDAPTTFPTVNGGCHPLWVLGHLTMVEGSIPAILFGEQNAAAGWAAYFGEGSVPAADAAAYPPFSEVREKYRQLRARNMTLLRSLQESDLDKPTLAPPPGREVEFATYGHSFLVLALHQMIHRSHVTDAQRARQAA
jgi:hypothetical protein